MEEQLREGNQRGFYRLLKSFELEPLRKADTQHIRDEDGNLLRDEHEISERWVRFFRSLLNAKSHALDPGIIATLPERETRTELGEEPTEGEVAPAVRSMANAKAVGPDELPAEF